MKLKFPKKIQIGECEFKVIQDKKYGGGSFNYEKREMVIGTIDVKNAPSRTLMIIIHELKEIINVEQYIRYNRPDDNSYEFHYTHREHTTMCSLLAGLLMQFIK